MKLPSIDTEIDRPRFHDPREVYAIELQGPHQSGMEFLEKSLEVACFGRAVSSCCAISEMPFNERLTGSWQLEKVVDGPAELSSRGIRRYRSHGSHRLTNPAKMCDSPSLS